ncbi:hypothetical protein SAMN05443572_1137 [Myxococcus fulvus]|uniref:Lipoprotein n=1 Tax=Myxococcus fulvus TaxID=33 RepID=A0A511TFU3_MYXFU|nr:hypothetical protein [Myxococcus fulvus]GEN13030.1 hypothetical protein MFU01_80670 [Myxococcus fulvus]SEU38262.1 hypothetical protein SAMN05443572_1137 [Myxococcus fulvus]
MKLRSLASSFLLFAAAGGCSSSDAPVNIPPDTAPVVDLPARSTNISGVLYDPEAFLVAFMTVPEEDAEGALPGVFEGPYTFLSAIMGGQVSLSSPEGGGALVSAPSDFGGTWSVVGAPSGETTAYLASATPPEGPVEPNPDFPVPMPTTTYFPTTYVRPILASVTQCYGQAAVLVGNTGALDAVSQAMTEAGTPTTPADLLDPTKTGGVALLFVHDMSFLADLFQTPVSSIAEASAGRIFPLDWAPVEEAPLPGQSPMGFMVLPGSESFLGYFALVLPPNATEPVTVNLVDTFVPEPEPDPEAPPRPYLIPPVIVEPRPGEVSVYRAFGQIPMPPGEEPPPGGGLEDPPPPSPEPTWTCYIPPPPVELPEEPVDPEGPPAE